MSGRAEVRAASTGRRIYVLWAVALSLLLVLGLFCWKVVAPYFQTRAAVERCCDAYRLFSPSKYAGHIRAEIERLGGPERAARWLHLYLCVPRNRAPERQTAVRLLYECGEAAVPQLVKLLNNEDEEVRSTAAWALGRIGCPRAVESLIAVLRDKDAWTRRAGAVALGSLEDPRAIGSLIGALEDEDKYVSGAAGWALVKIGEPAVEPLNAVLKNDDEMVREAAREVLKAIRAAATANSRTRWQEGEQPRP